MDSSDENEIDDSKRVEILKFLIDEAGADVTFTFEDQETLLDVAGWYGRLGVVKYILEEKKDTLKLEESCVAINTAMNFRYDLLVYLIDKQDVPVRTLMGDFYYGVMKSKELERESWRSLARIQEDNQRAARRTIVKAYLKGIIGVDYDSDNEEEEE